MINLILKIVMIVYIFWNLFFKYLNIEIILYVKKFKFFKIILWKNKIFLVKKE